MITCLTKNKIKNNDQVCSFLFSFSEAYIWSHDEWQSVKLVVNFIVNGLVAKQ